jgi:hypothetical protein
MGHIIRLDYFINDLICYLHHMQNHRVYKKGTRMRRKKQIEVTSIREVKSCVLEINVDDKTFNALAEAGRIHLQKDKNACFEYALNKALLELADMTK